jgi:hypothetical protein
LFFHDSDETASNGRWLVVWIDVRQQGGITEDRLARPVHTNVLPTRLDRTTWMWVVGMACCASIGMQAGCRSNAYSDVYNQKLASEVRVLEDQLYDADYQNRVLEQKLQRTAEEVQRLKQSTATLGEDVKSSARPKPYFTNPTPAPEVDSYSPNDFDLGNDIESLDPDSWIDPGTPAKPEEIQSGEKVLATPLPPGDPKPAEKKPLLPAPGGPEPPGPEDLDIPPVEPGDLAPPPSAGGTPEKPPGQILLPDAVRSVSPGGAKAGVPTTLSVHLGLSAGHQFEDGGEGLYLVVNVLDEQQRPLDLESFEIDAPLTIVATDPDKEFESSRIARWEFSSAEVAKMIRQEPVSGLVIPVRWQEKRPSGESVMVHVRLKGDAEEMRCEAKLSIKPKTAVAEWTPRSPKTKR